MDVLNNRSISNNFILVAPSPPVLQNCFSSVKFCAKFEVVFQVAIDSFCLGFFGTILRARLVNQTQGFGIPDR